MGVTYRAVVPSYDFVQACTLHLLDVEWQVMASSLIETTLLQKSVISSELKLYTVPFIKNTFGCLLDHGCDSWPCLLTAI